MSKFFTRKGFNLIIIIVDLIIIYSTIYFSFIFFKDTLRDFDENYFAFLSLAPYIGLAYLIISHIFELDKPKDFKLLGVSYTVILTVICLAFATMAFSFLIREFAYPRSILIISSISQIMFLSIWHLFLNRRYLSTSIHRTALIIGKEKSKPLAYKLLTTDGASSKIKYICNPEHPDLRSFVNECDVILLAEDVDEIRKQEIIEYCVQKNKEILYEPQNAEILLFNASLSQIDDTPVLKVKPLGLSPESLAVKRIVDILLSIIGLIVFFVPIVIVYICLKSGGGTAFYRQTRVTKDGKLFKIFKFRTMVENAEAMSGPVLAQDTDSRITKLGNILRATRMDEVPQIFNILVGDMTIVGPRPERPFFVEQFTEEMPEYPLRHCVKAGLTGYAQVHGKYNTSARDKLKYDLLYINSYSLTLDIKLIMQTLNILLRKSSTEGVKEIVDIEKLIEDLYQDNKLTS